MPMILGFNIPSREEEARKFDEYFQKIFPYGEPQKQAVSRLICALFSKRQEQSLLLFYIMAKEYMYDKSCTFQEASAYIKKHRSVGPITSDQIDAIRLILQSEYSFGDKPDYPSPEEIQSGLQSGL